MMNKAEQTLRYQFVDAQCSMMVDQLVQQGKSPFATVDRFRDQLPKSDTITPGLNSHIDHMAMPKALAVLIPGEARQALGQTLLIQSSPEIEMMSEGNKCRL